MRLSLHRKINLLFLFFFFLHSAPYAQTKGYIHKYRPIADSLSQVYDIPASVMLGVAVVESSSGTSRTARLLNNHFGIVGKNNLKQTHKIKTRYKQYLSALASYIDFCELIRRRKFYSALKKNADTLLWIDAISRSGYSEVPSVWKQRVIEVIKKNNLK